MDTLDTVPLRSPAVLTRLRADDDEQHSSRHSLSKLPPDADNDELLSLFMVLSVISLPIASFFVVRIYVAILQQ